MSELNVLTTSNQIETRPYGGGRQLHNGRGTASEVLHRAPLLGWTDGTTSLTDVVECMSEGLLLVAADGQVSFSNPAAARLTGSRELPVGSPVESCIGAPEMLALIRECLNGCVQEHVEREFDLDGQGLPLVVFATVDRLHGEDGSLRGLAVAMQDVTSLEHGKRSNSRFVRTVSHELRAPLGAIQGYLDIMLAGIASADPEQQHHMLERMSIRTAALLQLIDDLLLLSRLEQIGTEKETEAACVQEVAEEVIDLFHEEARTHDVQLNLESSGGHLHTTASGSDLTQILTNLISNGIKYNRPGGSVGVAIEQAGDMVRLAVRDTGLGVPAGAIAKLGEEFFRVKTPETVAVPGTGLGLSVVKRIIEAWGGRLEIHSKEGQGSTFSAYLPKATSQQTSAIRATEQVAVSRGASQPSPAYTS